MEHLKTRFIKLGWHLLEAKYIYYYKPEFSGLSDAEYDILESEYKQLAEKLGLTPTVSNMVGFDLEKASCRLVMERVNKDRKIGVLE